jgi:hypothetical protein
MVFTQDTVFVKKHYIIFFRFKFFYAGNAIGEIKPMSVRVCWRAGGARSARSWDCGIDTPVIKSRDNYICLSMSSSSARVSDPAETRDRRSPRRDIGGRQDRQFDVS